MLSTAPAAPAPSPHGSAFRAIAALGLASFASQALVRAGDTLLPQIADDFAVTVGAASVVITAYALTHGSMQFVTGPIADRFGKYRAVAIACALSAITVALCGLAGSLEHLTLARLASGVTVAWILPISLAYIGDVVPYDRRQQLLGRFLAAQILGQLFGQAAGGIVGDHFGWRTMFFLLAGMLGLAAVALTLELATNAITRHERGSRQNGCLFAGYGIVLRNPWARTLIVTVGLEGALFQGVFPYVSADLHLRFGLGFTAIGLIIAVFAAGGLAYAVMVKALMRHLGQIGIAKVGGTAMGLSFLALAVAPVWYIAPLATLGIGIGFFMLHNTLQTEATQMSPEARATSVALFASMYFIGQTVGVALLAPVMDRFGARPLFVTAGLLLPLLTLWFTRRLKRHQAER